MLLPVAAAFLSTRPPQRKKGMFTCSAQSKTSVTASSQRCRTALLMVNSSSDPEREQPELVLGDDMNTQMARMRSKYPTAEADYLAAARARAAAQTPSVETRATDKDWQKIAQEKRQQLGELDDWESSKAEAGNIDSQILLPDLPPDEGEGADDEPKLLLF